MDTDIEDLESLFSDHFGRTPLTTPWGSQEVGVDSDPDVSSLSDEEETVVDIDQRAREYLEIQPEQDQEESTEHRDTTAVSGGACLFPDTSDEDWARICTFRQNGCGCKKNCISQFTDTHIYEHILNVNEMEKQDKELYIMATLVNKSDKEVTKRGKKRQKGRHDFFVLGKTVCRSTFMLAFDVKRTCLQNLMSHVDEHGVVQRVHGNSGRKPSKSLKFEEIKHVVTFITNTSEETGLPQPAAPRGTDNVPPIYLPCSTTKSEIHLAYVHSCQESVPPNRYVKYMYTTFCNIWKQCLPHIKIATPRDDVCSTCEKFRKEILDSVTEEEKLAVTGNFRTHIIKAQIERDVYNQCITKARVSTISDMPRRYVHYTFDFSQNVAIPHHSRQMGPVYFISPRKVQIFGFRIDGIPRQLNFLIDENETIGPDGTKAHGPNAVISMIHWALESNMSDETECSIHADNCPGQNKNQFVIGYLMWRVMTGRHRMIEYLMQVHGHARCHVDAGFASIKRLYRRSDIDCIDQLEQVVNRSSTSNQCVRYPAWTWRDWKSFLRPYFKAVKGIRKYQYFRFNNAQPGIVMVKESRDADEQPVDILISNETSFNANDLPEELIPGGLTLARQKYLYTSVRPFVRPMYQNITCPQTRQEEDQ